MITTVSLNDFTGLTCWFGINLKLILAKDPVAPNNVAQFKSGQKRQQENHLAIFTMVQSEFLIHSIQVAFGQALLG